MASQVFRGKDAVKQSSALFKKRKQDIQIAQTQLRLAQQGDARAISRISRNLGDIASITGLSRNQISRLNSAERESLVRNALAPRKVKEQVSNLVNITPAQIEQANRLSGVERQRYLTQLGQRTSSPQSQFLNPAQSIYASKLQGSQREAYLRQVGARYSQPTQAMLSPAQSDFARTLSPQKQREYIKQVTGRAIQPQQVILSKTESERIRQLSPLSQSIASGLEDKALAINKRQRESEKKQAERDAKQLAGNIARKELITYFPKGTKTIGKGLNALINLGEKTFIGTLAFGEQLANAGEKVLFLIPALGRNISAGTTIDFLREFVSPEQRQVLKDIYTDPQTYKEALIGAGVMVVLGGIKSKNLTAKQVNKLPKKTIKYKAKTILIDAQNNVGFVSKSGVVKPMPRGLRTVTRAMSREFSDFVTRRVTKFPRTSTAKVGTVFTNAKGELRIVNKNGRVVRLPKEAQIRDLYSAWKKGTKARAKRTASARKSKAISKRGLTQKELKAQQKKLLDKQINKEVAEILKRYKVDAKTRASFKKAYKELKVKGTEKSALKLRKLTDKIEANKIVKSIDRKIKSNLRSKSKLKEAKIKPKSTTPKTIEGKISQLERKALKKPLTKKEARTLRNLKKDVKIAERFQAKIKQDSLARKQGFKDYKEQFKYEETFKKYKKGVRGADNTLKKIEKAMANRKTKASKLASKRFNEFRERLIKNAIQDLKKGKIAIKEKTYKVVRKRPQMPKKEVERMLLTIQARINRVRNERQKIQAKNALREIIEGKEVQVDSGTKGVINDILYKDQLKRLATEKRLSVRGAKPKTTIGKAERTKIKAKAKAETRLQRIARKRQKRSFAGEKQERKILRKQILEEIKTLERITKGNSQVPEGYTLEVTTSGSKLVPKKGKIPQSKRITTAKDILKKSKLKPSDKVAVGKDGTIQILKTKTKTKSSLAQRERLLKRAYNKLKQKIRPQKTKTKLSSRVRKTAVKRVSKNINKSIKVASALVTKTTSKLGNKVKLSLKQGIKSASAIKSDIKPQIKQLQKIDNKLDQLLKSDTSVIQKQAIGNIQDKIQDSIQNVNLKLEQSYKRVVSKTKPQEILIGKPPIKIKLPNLNWNTKLKKGYSLIVDARYKKGNKVITKRLRTTPNRARKVMNKFIDNNPQASYDLVVVGAKKVKDIKKPSMKKFTVRKGRDPKVRRNVEKTKFRLDRPKEKSISRIRRKKNANKNKNTGVRKKTSKKRSKRKTKK